MFSVIKTNSILLRIGLPIYIIKHPINYDNYATFNFNCKFNTDFWYGSDKEKRGIILNVLGFRIELTIRRGS